MLVFLMAGLSVIVVAACGSSRATAARSADAVQPAGVTAGSSDPVALSLAGATADAGMTRSQILGLLAGIPQAGSRLGNAKAPVTLTLYGDLECPLCRDFVLGKGFEKFVVRYVRTGKVKVIYRGFRTASPHVPRVRSRTGGGTRSWPTRAVSGSSRWFFSSNKVLRATTTSPTPFLMA